MDMVWLNGHLVGGWPFGHSSRRVDLTPYAVPPFPSHEREAFNGLCLVIIRAQEDQPGRIVLTASGEGLADAIPSITASSADR